MITKKTLKEKQLIYLVVALKAEAQAFVDRFKLKKTKLKEFTLFFDTNMTLIISGMGVINARNATQTLVNQFDITDEDIYLNVGICGADNNYEIGSLLEISSVVYNDISYTFKEDKNKIVCTDQAISENIYKIVDMESYGFYDAVIHNPAIKNFYIFKVVSDHFEPHKITKDSSKTLIFNIINDINKIIIT